MDLGGRRAGMRFNGEGVGSPFLVVPLSSFSPDLEGRYDGVVLHPSSSMVEFRVMTVDPLRRRIRNP
jgi:hypothetical protein